jgi:hypothetical protein
VISTSKEGRVMGVIVQPVLAWKIHSVAYVMLWVNGRKT